MPSQRIKLPLSEMKFKSLNKIINLSSLKYIRFFEIYSNSTALISFELTFSVNNTVLLKHFCFKLSKILRIRAVTRKSFGEELKLLTSVRICKHILNDVLLLTNKTEYSYSSVMFSCETPLTINQTSTGNVRN